jgi:peptidyl-dipeptidase Dcp
MTEKNPTPSPNPFFEDWDAADRLPPFDRIGSEHFRDAYARALAEHAAEVAAIAGDPAQPTFDNTIAALERAGRALDRVNNVFHVRNGAADRAALEQDQYRCGLVPPHRHSAAERRTARPQG